MPQQVINLGATGSGAGGDSARTAFEKAIANFAELYIAALPGTAAQKQAARDVFGLGSAATREAQVNALDGVNGMLLAYGAFGLGKQFYAGWMDANAYESSGFYGLNSGSPADFQNFPIGASPSRGMLLVTGDTGSSYCAQIYLDRVYNKAWFRTKSGTWGAWVGIGAEYGSNANGDYARFPNGLQICWVRNLTIDINVAAGSLFRGLVSWAFPAAFINSAPIFATSSAGGNHSEWGANATGTGGNGTTLRAMGVASRTGSTVDGFAIGRWQ